MHARSDRSGRLLLVALVLVGTGAAIAIAPTLAGASNASNDAADLQEQDDDVVEIDQAIDFDPHPDGNVSVELVVPADEVVDGAEVDVEAHSTSATVSESPNFERQGSSWAMQETGEAARLRYRLAVQDDGLYRHSHESWAMFTFPSEIGFAADQDVSLEYARTYQDPAVRKDGRLVVGDIRAVNRSLGAGETLTIVVPDDLDVAASPTLAAEKIVEVDEVRTHGVLDQSVLGVVVPNVDGAGGRGGSGTFVVENSADRDVWIHEYYHTVDPMLDGVRSGPNMTWYTEGYAEYGETFATFQVGNATYQEFASALETDFGEVRFNQTDSRATVNYQKGALVIGAIDYQIRQATEQKTYDDVVERLRGEDRVTLEEYLTFVESAGNETLAQRAGRWITTTEHPELWSAQQHEEVFGPIADPNTTSTVYREASGDRQPVDLSSDPTFYPNQNLTVEYAVTNEGGRATTETFSGALYDSSSVEKIAVSSETVDVPPGETVTADVSFHLDAIGEYLLSTDEGGEFEVQSVTPIDGTVPKDDDGDGRYEDFDADGVVDDTDAATLFEQQQDPAVQRHVPAYDFDGDGRIGISDVTALLEEV